MAVNDGKSLARYNTFEPCYIIGKVRSLDRVLYLALSKDDPFSDNLSKVLYAPSSPSAEHLLALPNTS